MKNSTSTSAVLESTATAAVGATAAAAYPRQQAPRWLEDFAACVRAPDYDTARAMFADDVVSFGTFARMLIGLDALVDGQWKQIWGCTREFRFLLDEAHIEVA